LYSSFICLLWNWIQQRLVEQEVNSREIAITPSENEDKPQNIKSTSSTCTTTTGDDRWSEGEDAEFIVTFNSTVLHYSIVDR